MAENSGLLMVTVSGKDRPGITAALSRVLLEHDVEIVDIEQASLQDLLGLTLLLDLSASRSADGVVKDLLFEASRMNLTLNFRLFSERKVHATDNRFMYVMTYFGDTRALVELSTILGEENVNIETISSLTHHGPNCVEMTLNASAADSVSRMKKRILAKGWELGMDLAVQNMEAYRKNKRLAFFDMDSTLIDMEVIDEIARAAGVHREVARVTEKAMRGEFDFEESLVQRVALLKGLPESELIAIRDRMKLSKGVEELTAALRRLGYRLGVVTGGFDFFADHLKERLDLDWSFANRLEITDGRLTGRVRGDIIDAAAKARIVNRTAARAGVPLDQVVVVGDGANDALMLGQAGLGIGYNAKAGLDRVAGASLGHARMMNILHMLGVTDRDMALIRLESDDG